MFNAGKTPKAWNEKMLNDEHYKVVNYWSKGSDVFDSVTIKGGVAVTMWNQEVNYGAIGTFITQQDLGEINRLVWNVATESFSTLVYSRDLYQLVAKFYEDHPELDKRQSEGHRFDVGTTVFTLFPEVFTENKPADNGYAFVVGRENDQRVGKWINKEYLKLPDNFENYKIFIPKANGSGKFGEPLGELIIAQPYYAHNTTFLSIGNFATLEEAEACCKYLKCKFTRALLGIRKVTQENSKNAWKFVPLQDFTPTSDIDWTQPIENIDQQLYAKYGLQEYIEFIENTVRPME